MSNKWVSKLKGRIIFINLKYRFTGCSVFYWITSNPNINFIMFLRNVSIKRWRKSFSIQLLLGRNIYVENRVYVRSRNFSWTLCPLHSRVIMDWSSFLLSKESIRMNSSNFLLHHDCLRFWAIWHLFNFLKLLRYLGKLCHRSFLIIVFNVKITTFSSQFVLNWRIWGRVRHCLIKK